MSLNAAERETVITVSDADSRVHIWTAQRSAIGKMRRHPSFTEVRSGHTDGSEFAEFTIPASEWNPASGAKAHRRPLTDEQREAARARFRANVLEKHDSQTGPAEPTGATGVSGPAADVDHSVPVSETGAS